MLSESHCHLKDNGSSSLELVMNNARKVGVELVLDAGTNLGSSEQAILTAQKYSIVRACVGVHPWNSDEYFEETLSRLKALTREGNIVAISEVGLDYVGRRTPNGKFTSEYVDKETQRKVFREQLKMAVELDLPVIVHDRTPDWEVLDMIENEGNIEYGVAIHGFSKGLDYAERCAKMGIYLSIGLRDISSQDNEAFKETVKQIPLSLLLTETDSQNPEGVLIVAKKIAELKGLSPEQVGLTTTQNLRKLIRQQNCAHSNS